MADFGNLTLTTLGSALLEKAIAGTNLEFTRAAIGDGIVASGFDLSNLTALVAEKMSIPINSIAVNEGLATLTIEFSNSGLSEGFHVRELGLFANDPDQGPILYAIANAGVDADWLPESGSNIVEEVFKIVPVMNGATKVTAVIDSSLTYVTKEEFEAHHHVTDGQNDGKQVEAKDVVNNPSGLIDATDVQNAIYELHGISTPPESDYIINSPSTGYGGKFTANPDLSLNVSPFEAIIGRKYHNQTTASEISLNARQASIIYAQKSDDKSSVTPILGRYDAVYPAADSNTVLRYVFNEASGNVLDSSGNGNDGIATGTVTRQVDGWCDYALKGDGSTGYITSTYSITAPIGRAERELDVVFTVNSNSYQHIASYGTSSSRSAFGFYINASLNLIFYTSTNDYNTGFTVEIGKTYYVAVWYDGTVLKIFVNGFLVYSLTITLATAPGSMKVLVSLASSYYSNATIHYLELLNAVRTPQQIAQISNQLCIPCHFIGYSALYPNNDTTSGAHIYKFDESSGTNVADEQGSLNGTAIGTTIVSSEIGLGYARKFNGTSDSITLSNYAFSTSQTIIFCGTLIDLATSRCIITNRNSNASSGVYLGTATTNSGVLSFYNGLSYVSSINLIPLGTLVFLAVTVGNGLVTFYINSPIQDSSYSFSSSTVSNTLYIGKDLYSGIWKGSMDYLAIIPRVLSQLEIAQYYNTLIAQKERSLLDDCLPSNSISLGFARTGSGQVIEYNDSDYWTMRNEGATKTEGNKRVFLGWRYVNTAGTYYFDNPFNTENINITKVWYKKNITDFRHSVIDPLYSSGMFGCTIKDINPFKINIFTENAQLTGIQTSYESVVESSGYYGIWVEMI